MTRTLSESVLSSVGEQYGLTPVISVRFEVGFNTYRYSSGAVPSGNYKVGITSFSGFKTVAKYRSFSSLSKVSLSILDKDQSLYAALRSNQFYKKTATIGLYYSDLPGDLQDLFVGQVASPINYDEESQSVELTIQSNIESKEIGFAAEEGQFGINTEEAIGKVWPRVFGKVAHVPAVLVQTQPRGELASAISFGLGAPTNDQSRNWGNLARTLLPFTVITTRASDGFLTPNEIMVESWERFPQNREIFLDIAGVLFRGQFQGSQRFVVSDQGANVAYPDFPGIGPRDVNDDDASNETVLWLSDHFSLINKTLFFPKESNPWLIPLNPNQAFEGQLPGLSRRVIRQEGLKVWLDQTLTNPRLQAALVDQTYTAEAYGMNRQGFREDIEKEVSTLIQTTLESSLAATDSPKVTLWKLKQIRDVLEAFWGKEDGTPVRQYGENPDVYVANEVPSDEVISVYGIKTIREGRRAEQYFAPIPKYLYDVNLREPTNIPAGQGPQTSTTIKFLNPLDTLQDQEWSREIYVSVDSTIPSNPAQQIYYLLDEAGLQRSLTLDIRTTTSLSHNFVLSEKRDAIKLIEDIAWQSQGAMVYDSASGFKYRRLSRADANRKQVSANDIVYGSFQVSETSDTDIATSITGTYQRSYRPRVNQTRDESRTITYRGNIDDYGRIDERIDYYTCTQDYPVRKSLEFWGNRLSNIWKRVSFQLIHKHFDIEIFDQLAVNGLDTDYFGISSFVGVVESVSVNPTNGTVDVELLTPYKQGSLTQDADFWVTDPLVSYQNYADNFSELEIGASFSQEPEQVARNVKEEVKDVAQAQTVLAIVQSLESDPEAGGGGESKENTPTPGEKRFARAATLQQNLIPRTSEEGLLVSLLEVDQFFHPYQTLKISTIAGQLYGRRNNDSVLLKIDEPVTTLAQLPAVAGIDYPVLGYSWLYRVDFGEYYANDREASPSISIPSFMPPGYPKIYARNISEWIDPIPGGFRLSNGLTHEDILANGPVELTIKPVTGYVMGSLYSMPATADDPTPRPIFLFEKQNGIVLRCPTNDT